MLEFCVKKLKSYILSFFKFLFYHKYLFLRMNNKKEKSLFIELDTSILSPEDAQDLTSRVWYSSTRGEYHYLGKDCNLVYSLKENKIIGKSTDDGFVDVDEKEFNDYCGYCGKKIDSFPVCDFSKCGRHCVVCE